MDRQVPDGRAADPGPGVRRAMRARHAAEHYSTTIEEPPPWLNLDAPPDPEGDERDWGEPGEYARVCAAAEADGAEAAAKTERLIAAETADAVAHILGAPRVPGVKTGPGGGFGQSEPLDLAAPEPALAMLADRASGQARMFAGVNDDELCGLLGAHRRLTARQEWETLTALAELIRRRPAGNGKLSGPGVLPRVWREGTAAEVSVQLAVTERAATILLSLAWDLAAKLPETSRMLRDGIIDLDKAHLIANACANLTPAQARQAEDILFATPDIGQKTRSVIRDRAARAVMEVDPDAARRRREDAAKDRRVEIQPEDSGNGWIAARELPPAAVLAIDRKLTARARVFKKAGIAGTMDELRALAFLERFGEADPLGGHGNGGQGGQDPQPGGPGGGSDDGGAPGPQPGTAPGGNDGASGAGYSGGTVTHINLTAPAADMTEQASRPGEMRGAGPVDPWTIRDMTSQAARDARSTWCFTITDTHGRPVAHACGRPAPGDPARRRRKAREPGSTGPPGTTGRTETSGTTGPPGTATLTRIDRGPPGSYGTWRYRQGDRDLIFEFEDLAGECDHRHRAPGHDPGRHLKHLTGVLNDECTFPTCRTPEHGSDYEHSKPWEQGGITCLCACGPMCRRNHRGKQQHGWKVRGTGRPGWFTWTLPSGRTYTTGPTLLPI